MSDDAMFLWSTPRPALVAIAVESSCITIYNTVLTSAGIALLNFSRLFSIEGVKVVSVVNKVGSFFWCCTDAAKYSCTI